MEYQRLANKLKDLRNEYINALLNDDSIKELEIRPQIDKITEKLKRIDEMIRKGTGGGGNYEPGYDINNVGGIM